MLSNYKDNTLSLSSIKDSEVEEKNSPSPLTSKEPLTENKLKRVSLRTPHPKKYANEYDENDDLNSSYLKKSDYILTTRDNSFISGGTGNFKTNSNYMMDSIAIHKCFKFEDNSDFKVFKRIENLSEYFINFNKLKRNSLNSLKTQRILNSYNNSTTHPLEKNHFIIKDSTPEFGSISRENLNEIYEEEDETFSSESDSEYDEFYLNSKNKISCHPLLSLSKRDDEVYKMKMIADMKIHKYNTDTHKLILFRKRKSRHIFKYLSF
jgi:hypothetical protein